MTGFPVNAEKAKDEIYALIASITGNQVEDDMSFSDSQSTYTPLHTSNVLGEHFISMPRVKSNSVNQLKEHSFSYTRLQLNPTLFLGRILRELRTRIRIL